MRVTTNKLLVLSVAAAAALTTMSCQDDDKPAKESEAETPPPDDSAPAEAIPVALTAVYCSAATATTYTKDPLKAESTTACIVKGDDGQPLVVTSLKVKVQTAGGEIEPPLATKDVPEAPWQVGVQLTPEQRAALQKVVVTVTLPSGEVLTFTTDRLDYDWTQDPLFKSLYEATAAVLAIGNPPAKLDEKGGIAKTRSTYFQWHVAVATSALFDGAVTVEAADAHCQKVGAPLVEKTSWRALLPSATASATARLGLEGPVLDFAGDYVAGSAEQFWSGSWTEGIRFTETGANVGSEFLGVRDGFVSVAWLGKAADECGGWTSREGTASTFVLRDFGEKQKGFPAKARGCGERLRLVCLSRVDHVPATAKTRKPLSFRFQSIDWRIEAWTLCNGEGADASCTLHSLISSGGAPVFDDVAGACGKKVEPDFTFSWNERSPTEGALVILATEAGTKAPLRFDYDTLHPTWVCK